MDRFRVKVRVKDKVSGMVYCDPVSLYVRQ